MKRGTGCGGLHGVRTVVDLSEKNGVEEADDARENDFNHAS